MKTKQIKDTLADRPSDLIMDGLDDLELIEKSKKYEVNMNEWHDIGEDVCQVCFAGGIIANRLVSDHLKHVEPHYFKASISNKLYSLDNFREGAVFMGFDKLNIKETFYDADFENDDDYNIHCNLPDYVTITPYEENKKKFKKEMRELACSLQMLGH